MCINQKVEIKDPFGLHLRAAVEFVTLIKKYKSKIWVQTDMELIDARSVLSLLQLAASVGKKLDFVLDGDDALEAMGGIEKFFEHSIEMT